MHSEAPGTGLVASDPMAAVEHILRAILGEQNDPRTPIGMTTTFVADLDLESIDLVTLTSELRSLYGERVDFPGFFASLSLERIAGLSVGDLVDHISERLG